MRQLFSLVLFIFIVYSTSAQDSLRTNPWQLKLLFVGDIMGHGAQIASANIEKNQYNYTPCFEYITPILQQADLAIGNLELTLPGKPPYQGYPQFRSPKALAPALREAGFDLLVTANNHANDSGLEGVLNTISTLEEYGFYQTGTFKNQETRDAFYPLLIYKNNFRLAFLNYTYDTNGIPTRAPSIVNEIKEDQIEKDMAIARQLKPDAIIVVMHWGLEYELQENAKQRALAQKLADWGADLIIGSHPHVVQPIKTIKTYLADSTEKFVPVIYSLGNFISGQIKLNTDGGIMTEINIQKDSITGNVIIAQPQYLPIWRWVEKSLEGKKTYRVVPISPYEADASPLNMSTTDYAAMLRYARATRKNLEKSQANERKVDLGELNLMLPTSSN